MSMRYEPSESTTEWERRVAEEAATLFLHVSAEELRPGDSMLGDNDGEFLIEEITPSGTGITIKALDLDGRAYTAMMPRNGYCKARKGRLASLALDSQAFGLKMCFNCEERRSEANGWEYNDYVCKVCREVIDSEL